MYKATKYNVQRLFVTARYSFSEATKPIHCKDKKSGKANQPVSFLIRIASADFFVYLHKLFAYIKKKLYFCSAKV